MTDFSKLKRYPIIKNDPLKAWDASDELVGEYLKTPKYCECKKLLLINDSFGALCKASESREIYCYSDSYVSKMAIEQNMPSTPNLLNDLNDLKGDYDLVVIKLPKNLSFLEDILIQLTRFLPKSTPLIFSGMIKHMANGHFDLINKYIGETSTSLAKKKARLIFANLEKEEAQSIYPLSISIPQWNKDLQNESNLFSREKLDIGTRFFLENIPRGDFKNILDLGCANGLIGLKAKQLNPSATIHFVDESYMAIKSARANYQNSFDDSAIYNWTNCYEDEDFSEVDLVLCNPPFHQGNTIGDFIAWQMFKNSFQKLQRGGKLIVIGNSHLRYNLKLKKIFGNCKIINQNKKFHILESTR